MKAAGDVSRSARLVVSPDVPGAPSVKGEGMPTGEVLLRFAIAAAAGYVLGSIPSGVIVSRLAGAKVDPLTQGSGKTGATNIQRTLGTGPAIVVAVLDILKGVAAVLVARFLVYPLGPAATLGQQNVHAAIEAVAAFAALLGHNFSLFIGFKGGRGVATGGGAILAMTPLAMVIGFVCLAVPVALTRYVSLGSILAAAASGITALVLLLTGHDYLPHTIFALAGATFIILSHRDNIERLLSGTERKLGQPAP
jgi:acyl phosphate:glycerol-3-phosphate acyltransferase